MRLRVLPALLLACTAEEPPRMPAPSWVYAPPLPAWQLGELRGRFGRSQAPQVPATGGIVGDVKGATSMIPLRAISTWSLPGEPARAVVYGLEGAVPAIELHDIDAGRVVWRNGTACVEPVIGVTASTIVCGGREGVRGIGFDGQPKWKTEKALLAITGGRVVVGELLEAIALGADDGKELARVLGPGEMGGARYVASCDGEWFAFQEDKIARVADVRGKPAMVWFRAIAEPRPNAAPISWTNPPTRQQPPPPMFAIDAVDCSADPILVDARHHVTEARSLIAIARATGKTVGRIDGVRGWWRARDNSERLEVATAAGTDRWTRDLTTSEGLALPPLRELLDARGDRRLVRATPLTAVVLDAGGMRAYVPLATKTAALGDAAIVGAGERGALRIPIPPPSNRAIRVPPRRAGVAVPAELRDLPEPVALGGSEIAKPDTGKHGVVAIALDPAQPSTVYAAALEQMPGPTTTSPVARADLATRAWTWQRSDGCGPGVPIGLALARDIVVCAARGTETTVRATSRDGTARWDWIGEGVDTIAGAGDAVLVFDADRLTVLDAASGKVRGRLLAGDGAPVRATVVEIANPAVGSPGGEIANLAADRRRGTLDDELPRLAGPTTWLVTYERGRIVARLPSASMIALWSLAVDGVVSGIAPSGNGVLVTLDDGDAYRIELPSATVTPMPGLNLTWHASDELVTGETVGGPIPGAPLPPVPRPRLPFIPGQPAKPLVIPESPTLWVPVPEPDPVGWSWQYTLYERDGGLRARNDYGLVTPVMSPRVRGPAGSPLVVASGYRLRNVMVLDPKTGDPLRRVTLPEDAPEGLVFGTILDGKPVAGTVLAQPLRIVLF